MDWSDEGVVLAARPFGEANAIAEMLTREHGRHLGLVRGGRSRRLRPLLQAGNILSVTWRARLSDHLGGFNVELIDSRAARTLDDEAGLSAISSLTSLARLLPERDAHPHLYAATLELLGALDEATLWPRLLVCWELLLLQDLGFGLDLSECALTGDTDDLFYVSPRSGRAVSREAGKPYCDKLLVLPGFLIEDQAEVPQSDILFGLTLTGHFLDRHVLAPQGQALPRARERLVELLARQVTIGRRKIEPLA